MYLSKMSLNTPINTFPFQSVTADRRSLYITDVTHNQFQYYKAANRLLEPKHDHKKLSDKNKPMIVQQYPLQINSKLKIRQKYYMKPTHCRRTTLYKSWRICTGIYRL